MVFKVIKINFSSPLINANGMYPTRLVVFLNYLSQSQFTKYRVNSIVEYLVVTRPNHEQRPAYVGGTSNMVKYYRRGNKMSM